MTMNKLFKEVESLRKSQVKDLVDKKLATFSSFKDKNEKEWFSELCFCILTANSKAMTALAIQKELGPDGFICHSQKDVCSCIRRNKHRFHNNKSKYIVEARKHKDSLKNTIIALGNDDEKKARQWLVDNVKGLGYKEASHFLRNVGYKNLAILDRHILNLMAEHSFIKEKPKPVTKKKYFEIEKKFQEMARKVNMSSAELDFFMWYMKTNKVLK
jgi:N-glycosylase/DNA lyase